MIRAAFLVLASLFIFVQTSFASTVDYDLPYPGILPDSPLYSLKAVRDMMVNLFISDPVKKAEFSFEASDKRFGAAVALFDKDKKELSLSTFLSGQNYFDESLENLNLAKTQGRVLDPAILSDMELSSEKQIEILNFMIRRTGGELREKLIKDLERSKKFNREVIELKPK